MSSSTKQIADMIAKEASRVTTKDLDNVLLFQKQSSMLTKLKDISPFLLAAGSGLGAGIMYSNAAQRDRIKELEQEQLQRNMLSAGLGALAAIKLRKPVTGLFNPDPEDLTYLEDDEFDDIWKNYNS